jgi:hypothetical protein
MATTININDELQKFLSSRKLFNKETYEEIIWDFVENSLEINARTKKEIELARNQAKKGELYSFDEVMKETRI